MTKRKTGMTMANTQVRPYRLPGWFKVRIEAGPHYRRIRSLVREKQLHTICEEARCPNKWECWNNRTATFLLLGDVCTRRCHYCSVTTGRPDPVDWDEPERVAEAVRALDLRHAVLTSVNRDELDDGGASMFAATIHAIRRLQPACTVEVLVPDFQGKPDAIDTVLAATPEIFSHNIETVSRLFPSVRPQGNYARSLEVLRRAGDRGANTKSGFMVGMGETIEELRSVLHDLRAAGCEIVSIGQYLQPTKAHLVVQRYVEPEEFEDLKQHGMALGFRHVESGPLVRSSYHAEQQITASASPHPSLQRKGSKKELPSFSSPL